MFLVIILKFNIMSAKNELVVVLFVLLTLISCENRQYENQLILKEQNIEIEDISCLKGRFSYALAKVLSESKGVRELIKKEALKQYDYDYDVLYMLVKDKKMEGNETLEQLLLQYIGRDELSFLLSKIPNLTIFVPSLPCNSFSAERWDTSIDIPCVAYKNKEGKILFVDSRGDVDDTFGYDEIPLFPVVVVKPSERVVLQSTLTRSIDDIDILKTESGINFVFEYSGFNNMYSAQTKSGTNTDIPERLERVFNAKKYADMNDIWQRDYIYYDILTKEGNGVLRRNISECLYAFELIGNVDNIYNRISDQKDDPHYDYGKSLVGKRGEARPSGWYGGNYEFLIKIYVSNDQLTSNEIIKVLSVSPKDLFILKTKEGDRSLRVIGIESIKKYYLPEPLPLFDWDIEHYSSSIKISIEEKDENVTEQTIVQTTTSFATNFGFDVNLGEVVKKGAKFGATASRECKISTTITRTLGNDELGDVIVNFGDDVVIKDNLENMNTQTSNSSRQPIPNYQPVLNPKYNSGYYKIEIVPIQMY